MEARARIETPTSPRDASVFRREGAPHELAGRFKPALGLFTDLYQLTMAYAHHRAGTADEVASFNLYFRRAPFGGSYAIAAGIEEAVSMLEALSFDESDVAYLRTLVGADARPLFDEPFLERLRAFRFRCDVDAVAEGELVFANEPLLRVTGPVLDAQLAETFLLNVIDFQTLIATKAARMVHAAGGRSIVEFGLRRGQGPDGGLSASRASYLGGAGASSNVLAGKLFGVPVRGTHAHSWVQFFDDERRAFDRYGEALGGNLVYLVDTYDTISGVKNAIAAAREVSARGASARPFVGIRLDSGDLGALAIEARRLLDEAGFTSTKIYASNDLDEHAIAALVQRGAPIDVFGVGTRLVTGGAQSSLGGVYKLAAVREGQRFAPRLKRSEEPAKASWPGRLAVERFVEGGLPIDVLFDVDDERAWAGPLLPVEGGQPIERALRAGEGRVLHQPAMRGGQRVAAAPPLEASRARVREAMAALHPSLLALDAEHESARVVVAPEALFERRAALLARTKGTSR